MRSRLTTYRDCVFHTLDFLGANVTEEARRDARRATLNAYRELASAHRWSYFYTRGRLNTVAPYSTGTVAVTASTGVVDLTGGVFPSWAPTGTIQINNVIYQIGSVQSTTQLTLTAQSRPGANIDAGATFTIYRDTFPLPADCLSIARLILVNNAFAMWYEPPTTWLERQRIYRGPATPRSYTIRGDPHYFAAMAVSLFPVPDAAYEFDYLYQRTPREMLIEESSTGTATCTSAALALTGSGTAWTSDMIGSVIRLSANGTALPDAPTGSNPAAQERIILAVASATSLTVDLAWTQSLTAVKHTISDPVDIESAAMLNALLRCCEKHAGLSRARADRMILESAYREALILAREADSRNFAMEASGSVSVYPYRLAQMPRGPDVS